MYHLLCEHDHNYLRSAVGIDSGSHSHEVAVCDALSSMVSAQRHIPALVLLSLVSRVLIVFLVALSSFLPLFDSSPTLALSANWSLPLLRWDAFHFLHLAHTRNQYIYEYEWAFFPGTSAVMRHIASLVIKPGSHHFLLAGTLAAAACDSTLTLYDLTMRHFHSPDFAFLVSLLSLLPSSPATLRFACYSEPFFTLWSYKGMFIL
jgi:phosphatidylinositol glycan class V